MIDVFRGRERHVYLKPLMEGDQMPSPRDFGPQDTQDLINLKALERLQKILPVLNGLVYMKQGNYYTIEANFIFCCIENSDVILEDIQNVTLLFDIFKYQLPIEIHEDALYTLLNLVQDAPKSIKEQLLTTYSTSIEQLIVFV
jgi:hypothetical protein